MIFFDKVIPDIPNYMWAEMAQDNINSAAVGMYWLKKYLA